jgi:hypothetical protein
MGGGGLATFKMFVSNNEGGEEKLYFLEACLVFAPCGPNFQHLELLHFHQPSSFDLFLLLNFETHYCFLTFLSSHQNFKDYSKPFEIMHAFNFSQVVLPPPLFASSTNIINIENLQQEMYEGGKHLTTIVDGDGNESHVDEMHMGNMKKQGDAWKPHNNNSPR